MDENDKDFWKKILKGLAFGIGVAASASYLAESSSLEPIHVRYTLDSADKIKTAFLLNGFKQLSIFSEIKKFKELWGLSIKIQSNNELHVRAIKDRVDSFYLSGHFERSRDSMAHLLEKSDYDQGKTLLIEYLKKMDLWDKKIKS